MPLLFTCRSGWAGRVRHSRTYRTIVRQSRTYGKIHGHRAQFRNAWPMIICLGTTPAVQRVMVFKELEIGEVNRAVEVHQEIAGKSVNVAKVLGALQKPVMAMGFVGGERGEFIRAELDRLSIEHDFV